MPAVSVIIPVYQAGKTLRRAVESVLRQSCRDFELLLSDDGSTDESVEIEEEFVRKDERIRILRSLHGGSAAARNAAASEAKGEYLFFMDADDWIEPDTLECSVSAARICRADLVVWDAVYEHSGKSYRISSPCRAGFFLSGEYAQNMAEAMNASHFFPWNKLFRRELMEKKGIRFRNYPLWDDACFCLDYLGAAERVCVLHRSFYHYLNYEGSTTYREAADPDVSRSALAAFMEHLQACFQSLDRGNEGLFRPHLKSAHERALSLLKDERGLRTALLMDAEPEETAAARLDSGDDRRELLCRVREVLAPENPVKVSLVNRPDDGGFLCRTAADRVLVLKQPMCQKDFFDRVKEQEKLHPAYCSAHVCSEGIWYEVLLEKPGIPAFWTDWTDRKGSEAEKLREILSDWQMRCALRKTQDWPCRIQVYAYLLSADKCIILIEWNPFIMQPSVSGSSISVYRSLVASAFRPGSGFLPVVSIITPAYRARKTLPAYIDSVLAQSRGDFELLLCDDGSDDGTAELGEWYAATDPRVRVLRLPHRGTGAARNSGIREARGKYILFADADDTMEPDTLEKTAGLADASGADLVVWNYFRESDAECRLIRSAAGKEGTVSIGEYAEAMTDPFLYEYFLPWNKLFRRDIIQKNRILFPDWKYAEDLSFVVDYFCHVRTVSVLHRPLYHYRVTAGTATSSMFEDHNREKLRIAVQSVFLKIINRFYRGVDAGDEARYERHVISITRQVSDRGEND